MTIIETMSLLYSKKEKLKNLIDRCRIAADNGNTLPALCLIDALDEAMAEIEEEFK